MPTISMDTYTPSESAVNQSLWGQDHQPTEKEAQEKHETLRKTFDEMQKPTAKRK
jgi:hypothetical protein